MEIFTSAETNGEVSTIRNSIMSYHILTLVNNFKMGVLTFFERWVLFWKRTINFGVSCIFL